MGAKKKTETIYYDLIEDYPLIESSFAMQYGIRLRLEDDMDWDEFATLLSGLNYKTPLGAVISIRSETDSEKIKKFTPEQRKIRSEWLKKQAFSMDKNEYMQAMKNFSAMFREMVK